MKELTLIYTNLEEKSIELAWNDAILPADFERIILDHSVFKFNLAVAQAKLQNQNEINASATFLGSICTSKFASKWKFQAHPLRQVTVIPKPYATDLKSAIPDDTLKTINTAGGSVDVYSDLPFSCHIGRNNGAFDSIQVRLSAPGSQQKERVIISQDMKHGEWGSQDTISRADIEPVLEKFDLLKQLLPKADHILQIVTNKHCPSALELIKDRDDVCILCNTADDALTWGLAPHLARFISTGYRPAVSRSKKR